MTQLLLNVRDDASELHEKRFLEHSEDFRGFIHFLCITPLHCTAYIYKQISYPYLVYAALSESISLIENFQSLLALVQ